MSIPGSERYSDRGDLVLEVKRQLFHLLLILLWCIPIYYLPRHLVLGLFFLVIFMNLLVVLRFGFILRIFSPIIEQLERDRNLSRPGIQALYANLGVFISYLIFGKLSLVGVVVLAVGDSLSTLTGKLLGRHRLFLNNSKTWEGTLSFFLSVYCVLLTFLPLQSALLVALLSSLLESAEPPPDDNLLIPVFATALVYLV